MATEKYFVFSESGELKRMKGRIVRFLDNEDPTGSDKSAIRTSLEVSPDAEGLVQADVGTAPNEIPVNGMLGDMAFQSSDGVSVATLEVTDKIDGSLGIGVTPDKPLHVGGAGEQTLRLENTSDGLGDGSVVGSIEFEANDSSTNGSGVVSKIQSESLNATGNLFGLSFHTGHGGSMTEKMLLDNDGKLGIGHSTPQEIIHAKAADPAIRLEDTSAGGSAEIEALNGSLIIGSDIASQVANSIIAFKVDGVEGWRINSSGNLVANSTGIDFGSVATSAGDGTNTTGTPLNSVFSDYETGSWTPSLSTGAGESITYATQDGTYTKIGRRVTCTARIYISSAATYGSYGHLQISGLPFVAVDSTDHMSFSYGGVYNLNSLLQVGDITGAQAQASGGASFYLQRGQYGGTSDVYYRTALLNTTGYLLFTVSYHTTA